MRAYAAYSEQSMAQLHIFSELTFVAAAHQERLDGRGYPRGLAAGRIPLETRIITIADFRCYQGRAALPRPDPGGRCDRDDGEGARQSTARAWMH